MVLFSNLIWKPELKKTIGQSMITLVFILLGGNTIVIVMVSVRKILRNKRLKYLKSVQMEFVRQRDVAVEVISVAFQLNTNFFRKQNKNKFDLTKTELEKE